MEATEKLIKKVKNQIFDEFAKNPASLAYGLLAASGRLAKRRADFRRWKKRSNARKAHKRIPKH